jgi:hypothetical protein
VGAVKGAHLHDGTTRRQARPAVLLGCVMKSI